MPMPEPTITPAPAPATPAGGQHPPTPRPANPALEYIAGGARRFASFGGPQALGPVFDDATEQYGPQLYEKMLHDPVVSGAFATLKQGILDQEPEFAPALARDDADAYGMADEDAPSDEDIAQADEICDFVCEATAGLETPLHEVLFELADAMALGCKLAELVYEPGTYNDRPAYLPRRIKTKHRDEWRFVVDARRNVLGIWGAMPAGETAPPVPTGAYVAGSTIGAGAFLPAEKFLIFSWLPRDNDPRGTSLLRPAYNPWNFKVRLYDEYLLYLEIYALGLLDGGYGPSAEPQAEVDAAGVPTGRILDPAQAFARMLSSAAQNKYLVHPADSTVNVVRPPGEGQAFQSAFDYFDRQISVAILQSTRGILEAQHGSKADTESAENIKGLFSRFGKKVVCNLVRRQYARRLVALNYGEAIAAKFTPIVSLGETEHQDFAANATAVAALQKAGYFHYTQYQDTDRFLGFAPRMMSAAEIAVAKQKAEMPPPDPNAAPQPPASGDMPATPSRNGTAPQAELTIHRNGVHP